jgi:hypothetical protein
LFCSAASKLRAWQRSRGPHWPTSPCLQKPSRQARGLGVPDTLDVAIECMLDRQAHRDDAFWPRHLHLEIGVVWDRHELGIARTPENGMVRAPKSHQLKGEGLLAEVSGMPNQTSKSICPMAGRACLAQHRGMALCWAVAGPGRFPSVVGCERRGC